MWVRRLLLGITLLGLLNGAKSSSGKITSIFPFPSEFDVVDTSVPSEQTNCSHILAVPSVLQSGKTGKVCVFLDCEETLKLDVTLEYQLTRVPIFNDNIGSRFFDCRDFPVPTVDTAQLAYVSFSAIGGRLKKRERKGVAIDNMPEACYAQLEKKLYRPGDTVRARVFCLNYNLKPTEQNFTRVRLMEPTGAVVRLVDLLSDPYVASVELDLNADSVPGGYRLVFERESGSSVDKYFSVQRYTPPRFDSTVTCPSTISVLEKIAKIDISAQYVYGKPLPATIIGKCCRDVAYSYGRVQNCFRGLENICEEFTGELDNNGVYTKELNLDTFKLQFSEWSSSLQCTFAIKEAGTGVLDNKYCYIYISSQPINLQLDYSYSPQYYKHGLKYPFAVTLTDEKGRPLANEEISITVDGKKLKTITTDIDGRAECAIDTTPYARANFTIRASYLDEEQCYIPTQNPRWSSVFYNNNDPGYPTAERLVYRFFSESDSFVQINKISRVLTCFETHTIKVDYKVTEAGVGKGVTSTSFYYLIKARKVIVLNGQQDVDLTCGWKGSFTIDLFVTPEYATSVEILVMGPMKTEIISDYLQVSVESCFSNQVSLSFTEAEVEPGSEVQQVLTAAPGSICGLRASDASLDILQSYDSFNRDSIYSYLTYFTYGLQVQNFNLEDPEPPCESPDTEVFCNGRHYRLVSSPTDGDTYENLKSMSLVVASDLRVRKPQVCGMEAIDVPSPVFGLADRGFASKSLMGGAESSLGGAGGIETFRSNFIDVFGWSTVIIGSDGKGIAISIIPDTITEWKSDMFCVSETEGVGLTNQPAKILTFLPFFVEMTVPQYSTRGERIILVTTASNYEEDCKKVSFTVTVSDGSQPTSLNDDDDDELCICKGETVSRQWSMDFIALGDISINASASTTHISDTCNGPNDDSKPFRKDTVMKTIIVEAEGIRREVTFSYLSIVEDSTVEKEVDIESPYNLVEDSFELHFSVVGDTVRLMADNLASLLKQPDGCCEQNLARLLPIAYLLDYFNYTGDLDEELSEKAKSYLSAGYARQLACRSWNGQYSVFRNSFVPNSWLDVNTYYAFEQIKEYTFVDKSIQQQTLLQLGTTQDLNTGCFSHTGSLFTVQDGYDRNNTIRYTAYVVKRLQKSDLYGIGDSMLEGALRCIQDVDYDTLDTYTLAYVFEAAALAELNIWDYLYSIVRARAISEGGTVHWRRENVRLGKPYYFLPIRYPSAEVDITSSIMLGILHGPKLNQGKRNYLGQIATWLSSTQNSNGGYSSSQDTISGTEAITEYGKLVFLGEPDVEVVVSLGDNEVARVNVNKDNKILVQRKKLPVAYGKYKLTITGTGNPLVQLTAIFNTKVTNEGSAFALTVTTRTESCIEGVAPVIHTDICASYNGIQSESNMVLIDVKQLTGYSNDRGSTYAILTPDSISEVDFKNNHDYFYLKSMKAGAEVCFTITSYMDQRAQLYQSSVVTIQDYYDPEESAYADYSYPCSPLPVV